MLMSDMLIAYSTDFYSNNRQHQTKELKNRSLFTGNLRWSRSSVADSKSNKWNNHTSTINIGTKHWYIKTWCPSQATQAHIADLAFVQTPDYTVRPWIQDQCIAFMCSFMLQLSLLHCCIYIH